jgi:uncharacterized membrane protein (DUF373 family)
MINVDFKKASQVATDTIFKILTLFVILALVIGTARIFLDMGKIYSGSIDAGFNILVTDILGMIVVLELFKGLLEYFELHRVRITLMADMTLIFVLRELMIALYQHKLDWEEVVAMSLLITALGGLRIMAIVRSPGLLTGKGGTDA